MNNEEVRKDLLEPYKIPEPFDPYNGPTTGIPLYFDPDKYCDTVEMVIRADELQMALYMCKNPPGYYRDNPIPRLVAIERKLYQLMYDQCLYATDPEEGACERSFGEDQWHSQYCYPRAEILEREISTMSPAPWIMDLGCSHGNLPLGLIKYGFNFSYLGLGMNKQIIDKLKGWVGDKWSEKPIQGQPSILCCYEVLEHMMNPHDLIHSAYKYGVQFDQIHLSTPLYTLGGGLPSWDRPLGHVRTWTPRELARFAEDAFPGYQWELFRAYSMVLVGKKR